MSNVAGSERLKRWADCVACLWVQAIRSYVREHEPDQLRSEMGAGAADIAEVVSDVKERLPDLKPPPQF